MMTTTTTTSTRLEKIKIKNYFAFNFRIESSSLLLLLLWIVKFRFFFFRYERLLRRAKTEDLSEVSGIGCLYQCGVDIYGRPVIIFVGKWFKFKEINLDKVSERERERDEPEGNVAKWWRFHLTHGFFFARLFQALLYLIYLLDPLVKSDYVIIYFHTLTSAANHPSFSWLREVYNILPYKYKKNLKAFYIVHPTFWTKVNFLFFFFGCDVTFYVTKSMLQRILFLIDPFFRWWVGGSPLSWLPRSKKKFSTLTESNISTA